MGVDHKGWGLWETKWEISDVKFKKKPQFLPLTVDRRTGPHFLLDPKTDEKFI